MTGVSVGDGADRRTYQIYQTDSDDQLLLPELAATLSLRAFLHLSGIQFVIKVAANAEHMSPSKQVPFIRVGSVLVSEFEPIVTYVAAQGNQPLLAEPDVARAEMKAYMALIERVLTNAERYLTYHRTSDGELVSWECSRHHAWPLSLAVPWLKRRTERRRLWALSWLDKSAADVCEEVETCLNALAEKLDSKRYFSERPNELDALVYGHVSAIMKHPASGSILPVMIAKKKKLLQFCKRIEDNYFANTG